MKMQGKQVGNGGEWEIVRFMNLSKRLSSYNMQYQNMQKPKIQTYYTAHSNSNCSGALKKKKLEIITGNKLVSLKKHSYNQNNPYSLPNEPRTPNNISKQTTFIRDTLTETSSQKSTKILRTNGMRMADKPNIGISRVFEQRQPEMGGTMHMRSLEEQNKRLREDNMIMQERMRGMEEAHKRQIKMLNEKMEKLFMQTGQLEEKMRVSDRQWNKYMQMNNGY